MTSLVAVEPQVENWFEREPSFRTAQEVQESCVLVSGEDQYRSWREAASSSGSELLRTLLERTPAILSHSAREDFRISKHPVEGGFLSFEDLLDSEERFQIESWRRTAPFLAGEGPDAAFARLFLPTLTYAREWQIVDQFLIEQLVARQDIFSLLKRNVDFVPSRIEIHSMHPDRGRARPHVLLESDEGQRALKDLRRLFHQSGKSVDFVAYERLRKGPNFPHPRVQMMVFDNGKIFTSLDNGLNSLARKRAVGFSAVGVRPTWLSVVRELKALRRIPLG